MSTYSHTRAVQIAKSQRISYWFNLRDSILGRHFVTRHAKLLLSPHLFTLLMLSRRTCQSIYFQLSELNVNFLHYLGLIDVLSAKKHAENFACVLVGPKSICKA